MKNHLIMRLKKNGRLIVFSIILVSILSNTANQVIPVSAEIPGNDNSAIIYNGFTFDKYSSSKIYSFETNSDCLIFLTNNTSDFSKLINSTTIISDTFENMTILKYNVSSNSIISVEFPYSINFMAVYSSLGVREFTLLDIPGSSYNSLENAIKYSFSVKDNDLILSLHAINESQLHLCMIEISFNGFNFDRQISLLPTLISNSKNLAFKISGLTNEYLPGNESLSLNIICLNNTQIIEFENQNPIYIEFPTYTNNVYLYIALSIVAFSIIFIIVIKDKSKSDFRKVLRKISKNYLKYENKNIRKKNKTQNQNQNEGKV